MARLVTLRELGLGTRQTAIFAGGFEIVADDGRTLYEIRTDAQGRLEISTGMYVKHADRMLTDRLLIRPRDFTCVYLEREAVQPKETT